MSDKSRKAFVPKSVVSTEYGIVTYTDSTLEACDYAPYKCTIDNDTDIDRQTDRHMTIVIIYTVQSQRRAGNNTLSSINNTVINKTRAPFRFQQWRSQKFSTGGASICSIPFCPFPSSCPTKSAVQSKNVFTYHTT